MPPYLHSSLAFIHALQRLQSAALLSCTYTNQVLIVSLHVSVSDLILAAMRLNLSAHIRWVSANDAREYLFASDGEFLQGLPKFV